MKTKDLYVIMVFVVVSSNGDVIRPFIIPHGLTQHRDPYQVPGEASVELDQEVGYLSIYLSMCLIPRV